MKRFLYALIALGVFLVDRWTKALIEESFALYEFKTVIPGFLELTHTRNTGMAFGIFSESTSHWTPHILSFTSVIAFLLILAFALRSPASQRRLQSGLMLVLGGAAGNLYDRLTQGYVTDFIDVFYKSYHWPTFNVADSAITAGAAWWLGIALLGGSSHSEEAPIS